MDSINDTYDDDVFEDSAEPTQTDIDNSNDVTNNAQHGNSCTNADDTFNDTKDSKDETTSAVLDTTLDRSTAIPDYNDTQQHKTTKPKREVKISDEREKDKTDTEATQKRGDGGQRAMEAFFQLAKAAAANGATGNGNNNKAPPSSRKVLNSQDNSERSESRYMRQDSEVETLCSDEEFETIDINNSEQNYMCSGFPSLLSYLGPNATNRTSKSKKKKQKAPDTTKTPTNIHADREHTTFTQDMKKRNESQWMRIEAVAKEKMDMYERYAVNMTMKIKRQREQINRRSQELMDSLARMEEKKREDKLYDSPHGRMWRHHRSMQRRVLNLEPISTTDRPVINSSQKSQDSPDE